MILGHNFTIAFHASSNMNSSLIFENGCYIVAPISSNYIKNIKSYLKYGMMHFLSKSLITLIYQTSIIIILHILCSILYNITGENPQGIWAYACMQSTYIYIYK